MGVILDSSVLIPLERQGTTVRDALQALAPQVGQNRMALSVITLLELAHGAARADTPARKAKRQEFIHQLMQAIPVHQVSPAIALRTGYIDGENQALGLRLPMADLLIGVTALELGYDVATRNPRHFQSIPGLKVVAL